MIIGKKIEPSIKTIDFTDKCFKNLINFAKEKNTAYRSNTPFPNIVIDGLFPDDLLQDVAFDVQRIEHPIKKNFYGARKKFASRDPWSMGATTQRFLLDLNSGKFCTFLEELTGIKGLIADPHLDGGGVHEIKKDGFLKLHTDFNWSKKLKLDRRVNVLIYLNKDWDPAWGGDLELWDKDVSQQSVKVSPSFNRTVIFSTSDFSFHGHPVPLNCPENNSRKSIALYYYTNGRPAQEVLFERSITTQYKERPGEVFSR